MKIVRYGNTHINSVIPNTVINRLEKENELNEKREINPHDSEQKLNHNTFHETLSFFHVDILHSHRKVATKKLR